MTVAMLIRNTVEQAISTKLKVFFNNFYIIKTLNYFSWA